MSRTKQSIALEDITEQTLRLLKQNLDRLEEAMSLDDVGEFKVGRANAATGLARGLSSVLKEARAINKVNKEAMTQLGPSEKRKLISDWFQTQPREVQRSILFEMTSIHNQGKQNAG